jgi:hypothetical protein
MAYSTIGRTGLALTLLVNMMGSILVIIGLSWATNQCRKGNYGPDQPGTVVTSSQAGGNALDSTSNSNMDCGMYYALDWFIVALGVFVSLVALFANRLYTLFLLAVSATLYIHFSNIYTQYAYGYRGTSRQDRFPTNTKLMCAGSIAILVTDFIAAGIISSDFVLAPATTVVEQPAGMMKV